MCIFNSNQTITDTSVSGYKVVYRINDKYYSPITGIQYKPGNVPITNKYHKNNLRETLEFTDVLCKDDSNHNPSYAGLTAIFKYDCDANMVKTILCDSRLEIIKMRLSGRLYEGMYGTSEVYLGSKIDSI